VIARHIITGLLMGALIGAALFGPAMAYPNSIETHP